MNHRVVSQAVVIATGVAADGRREVLGFEVGDSEDGAFWTAFLRSLKSRGLAGVQLVISDAHAGLRSAIDAVLIGPPGSGVECTSCATCSPKCPRAPQRWSPPRSAPSSPSQTPSTCANNSTPSPACSAASSPRSKPCCARPPPTSPPSPTSRWPTGKRSGQPTHWSD
ncbi:transposase, Mutator family protein [Mycobacterium xenopi 3993]|nr:transposase, Mutator family protein [Mycobacterium xenopi 3993]